MIYALEELPEILRPPQAAEVLTISVRTLYRLIEERKIGYFKVSERGIRLRRQHVIEYLEANTHEVKEKTA